MCLPKPYYHNEQDIMEKKGNILMQKYELGQLLGQGNFAKVYQAKHIASGESVAIKVVNKEKVSKVGLMNQIKREISIMRLVRHPNIVELYEVMASKSKIYFAMEFVKGGELFKRIAKGRLKEDQARNYFQQLIGAVEFCHSRGVYHRDLKPENLLLDEQGNLKITDFGLSALKESKDQDGLLHTTCGTPAYVAPEVINKKGYDGAKADIWSCGVVLYVLLAGFLPFHNRNLIELYRKIRKGDFKCPVWFPTEVRKLLSRILDPSPYSRITMKKLMENPWVKKGIKAQQLQVQKPYTNDNNPDGLRNLITPKDVCAAFRLDDEGFNKTSDKNRRKDYSGPGPPSSKKPASMNAFDIISSLSPGFDLSGVIDNEPRTKPEIRFTTSKPPSTVMSKFEQIAQVERFNVQKGTDTVKLKSNKEGRKGMLGIDAKIFEVTPEFHVVEVEKTAGDTIEYNDFYNQDLRPALRDVVWTWQGGTSPFSSPEQPKLAV